MRRRWSVIAAIPVVLSCATNELSGGPESPIRLDTQAAVGWEPRGRSSWS